MKQAPVFATAAVLAVIGVIAVFAPAAAAAPPLKSEFTFSDTGIIEGVCPFPLAVEANGSASEIEFFDNSGSLTRSQFHANEVTTWSANGKSLTTLPITYNLDLSGDFSEALLTGIIARVPLPEGGLFISTGRVDLAARGFPTFILTPDAGGWPRPLQRSVAVEAHTSCASSRSRSSPPTA